MKYSRFEDLPVWKMAMELGEAIYRLTQNRFFVQPGDLCGQLRRAGLSISNNIAEGFERGSTAELLAFLYIARGSAGEVRSMLRFTERLTDRGDLKSKVADLIPKAESCSRQIRAWADSLQNCDIKGQRHLNDRSREVYMAGRRTEAFERQLEETMKRVRGDGDDALRFKGKKGDDF